MNLEHRSTEKIVTRSRYQAGEQPRDGMTWNMDIMNPEWNRGRHFGISGKEFGNFERANGSIGSSAERTPSVLMSNGY